MHTQDLKYPLLRTRFPKIRYLGEHVKKCYCVDGRVGNNLGKREYFAKLTEARIRADQIEVEVANRGAEALAFSTENRVMAVSCAERLRPHGKTLLDATTHYVNWLDAEARHQQSPPISYVVEQYLEQRERDWRRGDLAELSFYEIRHRARRLSADLGTLRINELDAPRVRTYVESFPVSARTRLNLRLRLSKVCSFAVERGWLQRNPCELVKIRVPKHDVQLLTVTEVERLLRTAERSPFKDSVVPYLAISAFAAARPFEVEALDWSQVTFETTTIEILAASSKKRERRFTTMQPNLIAWLKPFARKSGRIVGPNFRKELETVRRKCGYGTDRKSKRWIVDGLRHTGASMLLALTGNRALVCEEIGTSAETLRTHYRQPILRETALKYFALLPMPPA